MRHVLAFASVLLAAALLTGCSTAGPASPTPAASASTPAVTPIPTATPDTEPSRAFDGDCTQVLPDPGAVLEFEGALLPRTMPTGIGTLGGLVCNWVGESLRSLTVHALPVAEVPAPLLGSYESVTCEQSYDWQQCHLAGVSAGTWVMVSGPALDESGTPPELAPALAAALRGAEAWPGPRAPARGDDWWEPIDCAALEADADIAGVFAPHAFEAGYPIGYGTGPLTDLLATTDQWCPWFSYDSGTGIWMNLLPGAGTLWDASAAADGVPVHVEGAVAAVVIEEFGGEALYVTDGANLLRIQESPGSDEELAARVLAALN